MAQSIASPGITTLAASDLLIQITPRFCARYHGTAAQLIAEGLIPEGFKWPAGSARAEYEMGQFTYYVGRSRPNGMKGPKSLWANGDYWLIQRSLTAEIGQGFHAAIIYAKTIELEEAIKRCTPEWNRVWHLAYDAQKDDKYMAFRQQVLGSAGRKPGRPAKDRSIAPTGASHV